MHGEEAVRHHLKGHQDNNRAERVARQEQAAQEQAASTAQAAAPPLAGSTCTDGFTQGSYPPTKLPFDVWSIILEKLCPASLSAIEGPSTIARDIINAQLVCRNCQAASAAAWGALATLIQADLGTEQAPYRCANHTEGMTIIYGKTSWQVHVANPMRTIKHKLLPHVPWDQVASHPLSLEHAVLEGACKSLGEPVLRNKAVFALRLLQYFEIDRPCAAPALVLLAVKHEKMSYLVTQWNSKQSQNLEFAVSKAFKHFTQKDIEPARTTMFAVRKVLASNFTTIERLLQWSNSHFGTARTRIRMRDAASSARRCACGKQSPATCAWNHCRHCCQGPCLRHHRLREGMSVRTAHSGIFL
ncbi:hypothetical protein ABBQ38_005630 [Trebouxia sp. C0009 RCD-2024]